MDGQVPDLLRGVANLDGLGGGLRTPTFVASP